MPVMPPRPGQVSEYGAMPYRIRKANRNDIPCLAKLLGEYMRETYQNAWGGTAQQLEEDVFGSKVNIVVAEAAKREVIAFVAWTFSYDLHHCLKGGEVIDLFVCSSHRGYGVALLLITNIAMRSRQNGGAYLKGGAVDNPTVHRLYQRIAMHVSGNDYYVSGRAFRRLAELSGKSLREIASNLPEKAWNYEP